MRVNNPFGIAFVATLGVGLGIVLLQSVGTLSTILLYVGTALFLSRCTACQLCISACPTHVLQPALLEYGLAGLLKPRLDYSLSFCNFDCVQCGEACPTGARGHGSFGLAIAR